MKKCLVCNKEFDDDSLFCPECGTRLVSNDTCPKCGKEVKPGEKYCRHCGKKIERIRMCQDCGIEVDDETLYCPKCGSKIPDDGFILNSSKSHSKNNKDNEVKEQKPANKIVTYIFVSLFATISLLFIIGMFGDFLKADGLFGGTKNIGYFYGEGASNLSSTYNQYTYKEHFAFSVIEFVISNIAYFGGLVGLTISLIFMIKNLIKSAFLKEEINRKPIIGLVVSVLPYLLVISAQNFVSASGGGTTEKMTYGWGTTILVVGVLLMLCTLLAHNIVMSKKSVKQIIVTSLKGITPIFAAIIVMFGMSHIIGGNESSLSVSINSAYNVRDFLVSFSSGSIPTLPSEFYTAISGYILILVSGIMFVVSTCLIGNEKQRASIVVLSASLVIYIVGSILSVSSVETILGMLKAHVGGSCIATYILGVLAIAAIIASLVLNKNKEAE